MSHTTALIITVDDRLPGDHHPRQVHLGQHLLGVRWGSRPEQIAGEVEETLAELLRERLGWSQDEGEGR